MNRTNWTAVDGAFWAAIAYLAGQISAAPSSAIIEHVIARRLLAIPADVQLGLRERNLLERAIAASFAPREYAPLPEAVRERALSRASVQLNRPVDRLDGETVFQAAFHPARAVADTAARLNTFLNQYGLGRNICFVSLVAVVALAIHQVNQPTKQGAMLIAGAAALSIGMFGRFIKYYAGYSSDVLRTYASLPEGK